MSFEYIYFWETVGLSLREQLQSTAVPIDESDWKLDMLVTPDEVIEELLKLRQEIATAVDEYKDLVVEIKIPGAGRH